MAGTTVVESHHYGILMEQLYPCKTAWDRIARGLRFHDYEIDGIRLAPVNYGRGPEGCMGDMLGQWFQWAPGDARGSKSRATLEDLKRAVDKAGFSVVAKSLTLTERKPEHREPEHREHREPEHREPDQSAHYPPSGGEATTPKKSEFSEDFDPSELCSWLKSHQVPTKDREKIKSNEIGGIGFKLLTKGDGWGEYNISPLGMRIINERLKKMVGIDGQSDSANGTPGRSGGTVPELPQSASLPPPDAISLAVDLVDADGGKKVQQFEAVEGGRGTYTPQLKFEDNSDTIDDKIKPEGLRITKEDKEYYKMNNPWHGVGIIINNKEFTKHDKREGTDRDEHNMKEIFLYLGYRPIVCRDLTHSEMTYIFSNLDAYLQQSDKMCTRTVAHDSFVCCILSHGNERSVISSDSQELSIEVIERSVGKSKMLSSKPKIFFIQACRGKEDGTVAIERVVADCTTSQRADFYLSFATTIGDRAYRDKLTGSWFITELCKILYKYGKSCSLNGGIQLHLNESVANNSRYRYKDKHTEQPSSANQLQNYVHFFLN